VCEKRYPRKDKLKVALIFWSSPTGGVPGPWRYAHLPPGAALCSGPGPHRC